MTITCCTPLLDDAVEIQLAPSTGSTGRRFRVLHWFVEEADWAEPELGMLEQPLLP